MHVRASQSSPELTASCTGTAARLRERLIRAQEDGQVSDGKTLLPLHQHQPLQCPPPAPPPPRPPPGLAPPLLPPPAVREHIVPTHARAHVLPSAPTDTQTHECQCAHTKRILAPSRTHTKHNELFSTPECSRRGQVITTLGESLRTYVQGDA